MEKEEGEVGWDVGVVGVEGMDWVSESESGWLCDGAGTGAGVGVAGWIGVAVVVEVPTLRESARVGADLLFGKVPGDTGSVPRDGCEKTPFFLKKKKSNVVQFDAFRRFTEGARGRSCR